LFTAAESARTTKIRLRAAIARSAYDAAGLAGLASTIIAPRTIISLYNVTASDGRRAIPLAILPAVMLLGDASSMSRWQRHNLRRVSLCESAHFDCGAAKKIRVAALELQ
jgi:hypothetical protein